MASKVFNLRTGLIVMFSILLLSYGVLIVFYLNSLYNVSTATPNPPVDVLIRDKYDDGSTIKVPPVVTVGEPFIYSTSGEKLVDTNALVKLQLDCKVQGDARQITPLNEIFSRLPKGKFDVNRSFTIPVSLRLQSSDDCKLQSSSDYIFYASERDGSESSFIVTETGESATFKLLVPRQPATEPNQNN